MEKLKTERLPSYADVIRPPVPRSWYNGRRKRRALRFFAVACLTYLAYSTYKIATNTDQINTLSMERLQQDYSVCSALQNKPVSPSEKRTRNKRWVNTTKPLLIKNATIWTGEPSPGTSEEDARAGKGWSWISGDIFIDAGLIQIIAPKISRESLPSDAEVFEANGRQLTTGIVDMHSHAGLGSEGNLEDDTNEMSADITPFVRSIDGIDPLQPELEFIKSGGVTTSLFLPGSGNNIGGEAYVLKFAVGPKSGRTEISQNDLLADPDKTWRYMKMACGENAKRVYGIAGKQGPFSRLGEAWEFRHAFEQARNYVQEQDDWCAAASSKGAENMKSYLRQELKWEALGAVLRGQVRVNTHCYTIADLESFVRHTNEFQFRVYAFHHAHQTYLVPEILKRAWGGTPAAALFADNMYYKVEAYRASEQAGAILYAHNITPTYVSDNPVLNSQHVVFEAARAYGYGLPYHAALAGVTSASAALLGLGDRIGKIKEGFDADIVVWDSDPLSAGATPVQMWIDGAPQFENPVLLKKPVTPSLEYGPKPSEEMKETEIESTVIFTGIKRVTEDVFFDALQDFESGIAVVTAGQLSCVGHCENELAMLESSSIPVKRVGLTNGHITTPLTAFGSPLGLVEIDYVGDTHDGPPPEEGVSRAVDGLFFGGKQLSHVFAHGVTRAISAPSEQGPDAKGVSVGFNTGAKNALEDGAIWKDEVALHYVLTLEAKQGKTPSISSAIGDLRAKLLDAVNEINSTIEEFSTKERYEEKAYLKRVVTGTLPLVLGVHSADTIASIIRLKSEVESVISSTSLSQNSERLRIIIIGGAEAHLVAPSLAASNIPVVLAPMLPHAQSWDQQRGLTGPPLTNSSVNILLDAGVLLGLGVDEIEYTRNLNLLAGIAYANSEGRLTFQRALDLVGRNFGKMLGIEEKAEAGKGEWIIWEGSPLEIGGHVRAIGGKGRTILRA